MQARKWISNSPEVMEKIPAEERATEIVIDSGQDPITKRRWGFRGTAPKTSLQLPLFRFLLDFRQRSETSCAK